MSTDTWFLFFVCQQTHDFYLYVSRHMIFICMSTDKWFSFVCQQTHDFYLYVSRHMIFICMSTDTWFLFVCQQTHDFHLYVNRHMIFICMSTDTWFSFVCQQTHRKDIAGQSARCQVALSLIHLSLIHCQLAKRPRGCCSTTNYIFTIDHFHDKTWNLNKTICKHCFEQTLMRLKPRLLLRPLSSLLGFLYGPECDRRLQSRGPNSRTCILVGYIIWNMKYKRFPVHFSDHHVTHKTWFY